MNSLRIEPKHLLFIALMAVIAVTPMLFRGIPGGNDAVQHYEFAQQVVDAINSGDIFPSFAGNSNHGFGDAGLRVYPPLSYYVLAGFYLFTGEWYAASLCTFFLIFFVGALGVYSWGRECFSERAGFAAAAVFTFAPFHLNEIYNNFLYAEFAAGAILPFCFLFVTRVLRTGRLADTLLFGIAFALLVITHLPLTVIGSISLAAYTLASIRKTNYRKAFDLALGICVALTLSSFYWVRMITEMSWVKHSQPEYYAKIWSYQENFLISLRTFTDFMNDGLSLWFGDLMLVGTVLLCIPALILVARRFGMRSSLLPIAVLFAFGIFMATPLSSPIWDLAGVLQRVQFPWRWLSIITVAGSIIAGAGLVEAADLLKAANSKIGMLAAAAVLIPFVFLSAFVVRAPHFTERAEFNERGATLSAGETFEGWWPLWAKRQAFSKRNKVNVNGRAIEVERWEPTERSFKIAEGEPQEISISTFYYPHWKASVDGRSSEVRYDSEGRILLQIPSNAVEVDLKYIEPTPVVNSALASAIGWSVVIILLATLLVRHRKTYDYS